MPRTSFSQNNPPPGPIRRKSLLTRHISNRSSDESLVYKLEPKVPIELLDRIIELFVALFCQIPARHTTFVDVQPLTLVSKIFRQLALGHYFRTLVLEKKARLGLFTILTQEDVFNKRRGWNGGFTWVRSLYASSDVLASAPESVLVCLTMLKELWIDFSREGMMTDRPLLKLLFNDFANSGGASNVTSLTVTSLPRLDVYLLKIVAQAFPCLADLRLSCTDCLILDCCPCCYEDSLTRTFHSPIPDIHPDVEDLAVSFCILLCQGDQLDYPTSS
ncbi:hypothetical protein B0H34DRAFT_421007 [Crassisporium funariophilum]|nr:hypothetical protein B0H34DRAFT_421007 [Crassisporium funariophilum]